MEIPKQTDIVFFLVTGIAVLLLLAASIILFFRLYTKKILYQQAQLLREETKHKEELLFGTIASVEAERKRIATDIHDEIGSIFSTLSISINRLATARDQPVETAVKDSLALIEKGMTSVRRIAHTMMPPELEMFGLLYTIESLCEKLAAGGIIKVSFKHALEQYNPTPSINLAVYRILQELTSNTIKHAGAKNIAIEITSSPGLLYLIYKDDGKGMDTPATGSKGMGLKNIESRVSMIKGKLAYATAPHHGITCEIEIPIQNNLTL